MIDKKIDEISKLIYIGLSPDKAREKIKSLFKEYAMEIIGEDEEVMVMSTGDITEIVSKEQVIRNELRAEQREKVGL